MLTLPGELWPNTAKCWESSLLQGEDENFKLAMETTFTFRNIEASDALKDHTLQKLEKVNKYLIKPTKIHVIFNVEKFNHQVEITLIANGIQYISHEKAPDMYASIDLAIGKLERQLKKYKEQLKKHHNHHTDKDRSKAGVK